MICFDIESLGSAQEFFSTLSHEEGEVIGGEIVIERNINTNSVEYYIRSDFGQQSEGETVLGFDSLRLWISPDIRVGEFEIFLSISRIVRKGQHWLEVIPVAPATTSQWLCFF